MNTNKPAHEIKLGRIKATIWANDTSVGVRYNVIIGLLYKDGDEWKSTPNLGFNDLLLAAKALNKAHDWILTQTEPAGSES
jgi:hypothetical protein